MEQAEVIKGTACCELPGEALLQKRPGVGGKQLQGSGYSSSSLWARVLTHDMKGLPKKLKGSSSSGARELAWVPENSDCLVLA